MRLEPSGVMCVPKSSRDILSDRPNMRRGILHRGLDTGIGFGRVVRLVVAMGSIDCVGGEAPNTEARRDVCGAADKTGVDRYIEQDCYDGKPIFSDCSQAHSPFRQ